MNPSATNSTTLITGTDGFIGSYLTEGLVRQGHKVRAFVLYNSFNSWGWSAHRSPDVEGQFETSVGDTGQLIAETMNVEIETITDEARLRPENSEVERLCADNAKAKQLFSCQPSYGGREGFKRGLAEMVEWFAQPGNLRGYKADIYNP